MSRKTQDQQHWQDELGYIRSVSIRAPGAAFNHDPDCFARYCDMQANSARGEGFRDVANEINGIAVAALVCGRARKQIACS